MLALAVPALSMRLSFQDSSYRAALHDGVPGRTAILADGFGAGYDAPLVVVADRPPG